MKSSSEEYIVFTIGHSNYSSDEFVSLLKRHSIEAVADIRSNPHSRFSPQYNRENIQHFLRVHGIKYVFLGQELGARSDDSSCYKSGKIQFKLLSQKTRFRDGIRRLRQGIKKYRLALMCAEKEPMKCHRSILVCRELRSSHFRIRHILEDGRLEDNSEFEKRLMNKLGIIAEDLFKDEEQLIAEAYDKQANMITHAVSDTKDEFHKKSME